MKQISRVLFILLLSTFVLQSIVVKAFASEYKYYDTEYASPENEEQFLKTTNIDLLTNEEYDCAFTHFALSETGLVALGFNTEKYAVIYIYDFDGKFQYGYQFINNNCAFAFYFEDDQMAIHWAKSDYIGRLDADGNIHHLRKVRNTTRNHDTYHANRYRPASGRVGDFQYYAEGNWLSQKYSRFIIEDSNGNKTVIYDVVEEVRTRNMIGSMLLFSAASFIMIAAYKSKKEGSNN